MRRWIGAFVTGFFVYVGLSIALTDLIGDQAAAGIGFVAGIAVLIWLGRRPQIGSSK